MNAHPYVLLVAPHTGHGWRSITNYSAEIAALGSGDSIRIALRTASWWAPALVAGVLDRRRSNPRLTEADAGSFDLVHFADLGLAHHVTAFSSFPTVVTIHDVMPFVLPRFSRSPGGGTLQRRMLGPCVRGMRRASLVIAVSETTARDLSQRFSLDPGRITVVPVPISREFQPMHGGRAAARALGIALPEGPLVLSVGRNAPNKNLETLIRAFAEPVLAGSWLVRVGERLSRQQLQLARRLGVASRIVEVGSVSRDALLALYAACNLLVQPSVYEGFGMPVVEAMACGLPVVCSDGGALPEVAGDSALVVPLDRAAPDKDPAAFADAMRALLSDAGLAARLRAAGLMRARAFQPERIGPALFDAYRSVLAAEPARVAGSVAPTASAEVAPR